MVFYQGHCAPQKGKSQAFCGLLDVGSEVTLLPGDLNITVAHSQSRANGGQVVVGF